MQAVFSATNLFSVWMVSGDQWACQDGGLLTVFDLNNLNMDRVYHCLYSFPRAANKVPQVGLETTEIYPLTFLDARHPNSTC